MSSEKLNKAIELFSESLKSTLDSIPDKAMAQKYRKNLDALQPSFLQVVIEWNKVKDAVLATEEEKAEQQAEEAKKATSRLIPTLDSRIKSAKEKVQKFRDDDINFSPRGLEWADDLYAGIVDERIAKELKDQIEYGTSLDDLRAYVEAQMISAVRSLNSSSSSTHNMVTEYQAKAYAWHLQWLQRY